MKTQYLALASLQTALAIAIGFSATDAQAVTVQRYMSSTATGLCQPAMPVYDSLIRKRPLGVQNQGTAPAFVTCSLTSSGYGGKEVSVQFFRVDGAPHNFTCTGVVGAAGNMVGIETIVKQVSITSDPVEYLTWEGVEFQGVNGGPPSPYFYGDFSISCELPPGVGIGNAELRYDDEDQT